MEWVVTALTVGLVVLVLLGRVAYGLMSRAARRKQPGSARASVTATPNVRLALDSTAGLFSRRAVVWNGSDELARIRLRAGLRHLRGECVTRDAEYVCEAERGWPLGRRRVTLRRRPDGTVVAHTAQPRSWTRRVALRGGIEFPHGPERYALRPARRGGATLRANGNPVGAFVPHPGSLRCEVTFPSILDGQAELFLIAAAVACNYTTAKTSGRRNREPMGPFGEGARIAGAVGFAGAGTTAARAGGGGGEATSAAWQRGTTPPT